MSEHPIQKRYLGTREAAQYTGIPASTLRQYRHENKGPLYFIPPGTGRALYDIADLDTWIQSGRRVPSVRAAGKDRQNVAV